MSRAEQILLNTLAAYGLLKILESFVCPPRPPVVIVTDETTAAALRDLVDAPESGE
jgi:hypothetical protein